MIRVLNVMSSIGSPGGVQSLIWNYYKNIDENKIRFDFVVFNNQFNGFEKRFLEKKSKINFVTPKKKGFLKHYKELDKAIKSKQYEVVHCHQDFLGYVTMFLAWKNHVPIRVIHSHKANLSESIFQYLRRFIFTKITLLFANYKFACGEDAAIWTYGKRAVSKQRVFILNNAIDIKEYAFNQLIRDSVREKLGIGKHKVIGNVARFTYQKNHDLLIKVFKEVYKNDTDYRLLLVGDGEDFMRIKEKIQIEHLDQVVFMLGNRNDVSDLLQAMDVFVLTSRFEGLPVTLVEAQCNGLPCVVTDNITKEVNITGQVRYLSCGNIDKWKDSILNLNVDSRELNQDVIKAAGFDIYTETEKLCSKYKEMLKERTK